MQRLDNINVSDISPDPNQPRKDFEPEALRELADSIAAIGVIQPILIRPSSLTGTDAGTKFMIIAGERRWRASVLAEKPTIPAVIDYDSNPSLDDLEFKQLTENLFREDLNVVEKAEFLQRAIQRNKDGGISKPVEALAKSLGVSASWVSKGTAVLKISADIRLLALNGLVRDYSLLKKLDQLKGSRRDEAIVQLNEGSFNSVEFFKRKRYDKKTETQNDVNNKEELSAKSSSLKPFDIKLQQPFLIKVIDNTSYKEVLDNENHEWRQSSPPQFKEYFNRFSQWVNKD